MFFWYNSGVANILNWREQVKFSTGDTIRVYQNVTEGGKTRTQIFEGIVLRIKGHEGLKSFTVRKIANAGVGVERIFPELTPTVTKIEVTKRGKTRRANLGYLRGRLGKKAIRVKDHFVKLEKGEVEVPMTEAEKEERQVVQKRAERALPPKEKNRGEKAEKVKKAKKKKIVRKEKVFVR